MSPVYLYRLARVPFAPPSIKIRSPRDAFLLLREYVREQPVEVAMVLHLDAGANVLAVEEATRGIVNSTLITPREAFRGAIVHGASHVIFAHNHPSGDPTPSEDDRATTRMLSEAGRILDIPLVDSLIVAGNRYFSFAEMGLL